jgi:hypothetical protein
VSGRFKLIGVDKVMRNLNEEINSMKNRTAVGLIKACVLVRRDMEFSVPVTPVDTGNLRQSWYIASHLGIADGGSPVFRQETKDGKQISSTKVAKMTREHAMVKNEAEQATYGKARLIKVIMGFSANYGIYVHENINPDIKWNRAGSGPKFFQSSISSKRGKMLKTIQRSARIGGETVLPGSINISDVNTEI